jgi:hypothetical protein
MDEDYSLKALKLVHVAVQTPRVRFHREQRIRSSPIQAVFTVYCTHHPCTIVKRHDRDITNGAYLVTYAGARLGWRALVVCLCRNTNLPQNRRPSQMLYNTFQHSTRTQWQMLIYVNTRTRSSQIPTRKVSTSLNHGQ